MPRHDRIAQQRGAALILVLLLSSLLLVLVSTGLSMSRTANRNITEVFRSEGQVGNIAQAGLQDAIAWFKRHQPVQQDVCKDGAFNPVFDMDPELSETDNASLGIVRDIQLKDSLYGRYIVKKQPCGQPDDPHAVHDITAAKGKSSAAIPPTNSDGTLKGEGAVWSIESEGTLYLRQDFRKTNNVFVTGPEDSPNKILRKGSAAIEISQLTVNVGAAPLTLFGTSGSQSFNSRCRLLGMPNALTGVYYNGVNPNVASAERQLPGGSPDKLSVSSAITPQSVFSVSASELKGMADNVYSNLSQIPNSMQKFSITYLDGNFSFTTAKPLQGGGLLYVNGNLSLADGSNSLFSGVIFVNGRLTIGKDNHLAGAIVASNITCSPGSGNSNLEYNSNLVTTVRQKLALYRENNLTRSYREY